MNDPILDTLSFEQQIASMDADNLVRFAARQAWETNKGLGMLRQEFAKLPCHENNCTTNVSVNALPADVKKWIAFVGGFGFFGGAGMAIVIIGKILKWW